MTRRPFLLLTGIPRSGTTLTASLIYMLEDTICLHEPSQFRCFCKESRDEADFAGRCLAELKELRASLLNGGTVTDGRTSDGSYPTNYFDESGSRVGLIPVPSRLPNPGPHSLLAVKHNEVFTSILPKLLRFEELKVVVVIRHPVPTMLSWQSRTIPLSSGQLAAAYRYWDEALRIRDAGGDVRDVQAKIYELYCARYWEHRDRITILRYEDIVERPGVLEEATGRRFVEGADLSAQSMNHARRTEEHNVEEMKIVMSKYFKTVYEFYPDLSKW